MALPSQPGASTLLAHEAATPAPEDRDGGAPGWLEERGPFALFDGFARPAADPQQLVLELFDEDALALQLPDDAASEGRGTQASQQEEEDEELPIFFEHAVQPGETVSEIAERYGVGTDHILWNNIDILVDADTLAVGTVLQVPSLPGVIHSVRLGETVSGIAEHYDTTIAEIVEFAANGFNGDPDNLPEGSQILVPGGRMPAPPPVEEPDPSPGGSPGAGPGTGTSPTPAPTAQPTPAPVSPTAPGQWVWPARGRITNLFSARHPLGIDISMIVGTRLAASAPGQVVFVGGNACCSYGHHVIIRHENGYESLYAHLSRFAVENGQHVAAGELIGWSGNTGRSTGPHLHFEIRRNGVHQDPMKYLP